MSSIYDFDVVDNKGQAQSMAQYKNKVLLIVNTASKCGFTPQYAGLQALYQEYNQQGFAVLAFPCNQFGKQEQGSNQEIASFCDLQFHISFPLFEKVEVNGEQAHPLYQFLKSQARGLLGSQKIKWNFTKFLINKNGDVLKRYAPSTKPEDIIEDIKKQL